MNARPRDLPSEIWETTTTTAAATRKNTTTTSNQQPVNYWQRPIPNIRQATTSNIQQPLAIKTQPEILNNHCFSLGQMSMNKAQHIKIQVSWDFPCQICFPIFQNQSGSFVQGILILNDGSSMIYELMYIDVTFSVWVVCNSGISGSCWWKTSQGQAPDGAIQPCK